LTWGRGATLDGFLVFDHPLKATSDRGGKASDEAPSAVEYCPLCKCSPRLFGRGVGLRVFSGDEEKVFVNVR